MGKKGKKAKKRTRRNKEARLINEFKAIDHSTFSLSDIANEMIQTNKEGEKVEKEQ
jgi:hypothetical protein